MPFAPAPVNRGNLSGGTSARDLPASVENHQDFNRRSNLTSPTFLMVRDVMAPDPAYRPTHPKRSGGSFSRQARRSQLSEAPYTAALHSPYSASRTATPRSSASGIKREYVL